MSDQHGALKPIRTLTIIDLWEVRVPAYRHRGQRVLGRVRGLPHAARVQERHARASPVPARPVQAWREPSPVRVLRELPRGQDSPVREQPYPVQPAPPVPWHAQALSLPEPRALKVQMLVPARLPALPPVRERLASRAFRQARESPVPQ